MMVKIARIALRIVSLSFFVCVICILILEMFQYLPDGARHLLRIVTMASMGTLVIGAIVMMIALVLYAKASEVRN